MDRCQDSHCSDTEKFAKFAHYITMNNRRTATGNERVGNPTVIAWAHNLGMGSAGSIC